MHDKPTKDASPTISEAMAIALRTTAMFAMVAAGFCILWMDAA